MSEEFKKFKIDRAQGNYLYTYNNHKIFDGSSGAINVNLGHRHPKILEAISLELEKSTFTWRGFYESSNTPELKEKLTEISEGKLVGHIFTSSGSDAVEQALRIAWVYHLILGHEKKNRVLSELISYHGMTTGALGVSGHRIRHTALGTAQHRVNDLFVTPTRGLSRPNAEDWGRYIDKYSEELAAIIIETVSGASFGAMPQDPEVFKLIRKKCTELDILIIADEVMTSFGRTGKMISSISEGLEPDIVVTSKGLGVGHYPVGACSVNRKVETILGNQPDLGTFGHTMAENPIANATALAVLATIECDSILSNVSINSTLLAEELNDISETVSYVHSPRGKGFLWSIGIGNGDRNLLFCNEIIKQCIHNGVSFYPAGVNNESASILIAPPLNSTSDDIKTMLQIFKKTLGKIKE